MKKNHLLFCVIVLSAMMFTSSAKTKTAAAGQSENAVVEAIMARRSIRKYQDKPVPRELLQKVAECGVNAPNAMNAQRWEVRIVDDPAFIHGVSEVYKAVYPEAVAREAGFKNMFRNAPAIICVAAVPSRYAGIDTGLMGENMMLAAYSFGLGTCCLGGPVEFLAHNPQAAEYYKRLNFSEGYELQYILAIGYPDEAPAAKPRDLKKIQFVK